MDFAPTQAMEQIRAEVRQILAGVLPPDWQGAGIFSAGESPQAQEVVKRLDRALAERNLVAPAWPEEYGGRNLGPFEHFVVLEEMAYAMAPRRSTIAVDLVGPVLLLYGNEEQRRRYLPAIAKQGQIWCQGFSEPGAGSDLTNLRTRAERRGDVYVVNGQKIWTSEAHIAQWIILLCRTGPPDSRSHGLSILLVPTESPGIHMRPIYSMDGHHMFNEVFYEDVQVPAENLVGNENEGWRYATTLLQFERGDAIYVGQYRRLLDDLEKALRQRQLDGSRRQVARAALAQAEVEYRVMYFYALNAAYLQTKDKFGSLDSSTAKVFATEALQRLALTAHRLAGLYGNLLGEGGQAPLGGRIAQSVMGATGASIAGGTNEIQRNIIATRGLGLPRG